MGKVIRMGQLQRATPEGLGIPSENLIKFYRELSTNTLPLHHFILMRHGKVATQGSWHPYRKDMNHMVYSTSKTIAALAIGFCVEEGRFTLDDRIVDFFPEMITGPLHEFNRMRTVRDLLTMRAGETGDATSIDRSYPDWLKTFLNTPPRVKPGTLYGYDNSATHALAALIQKVTGEMLIDYLRPRLFDPLGIDNTVYWEEQMGINTASRGFHCKIEDLAKMAQLVLQHGEWEGKQIISRAWLDEATAKHSEVTHFTSRIDSNPGYGYKFWMYRDGSYGTRGNGGQNFIVYPKRDVAWAFLANLEDSFGRHAEFMHMAWPILFDNLSDGPLPENPDAYQELLRIEQNLEIPLPEGIPYRSPKEDELHNRKYVVAKNSAQVHTITFSKTERGMKLSFCMGADAHVWEFEAYHGSWKFQPLPISNDQGWARYVWRNENIVECVVLLKEVLGSYRMVFYVGDDNSLCIDIYPVGWRDMNRSLELFGMGYCWDDLPK